MTTPFLYQPVYPWRVNQPFGANTACINLNTGKVVSCNGHRPPPGHKSVYSMMLGHNGIDARAWRWQRCYAAAAGRVVEKQTEPARGLGISILHPEWEGRFFKTSYWHLAAMDVDMGDQVSAGQLVGYCDNTGYSSGDHLHFQVKETDADGNTINKENGYLGAIDPAPLMLDRPAFQAGIARATIEVTSAFLDSISDGLRGLRTG